MNYLEKKRIAIIIAAKNEENVIKYIIQSLLDQTYNSKLFNIYLVADNCTDQTANIAKSFNDKYPNRVIVLERFNEKQKGANFAIQYAIKYINESNEFYDAYCYFDADNIVDKNWLTEVEHKLEEGNGVVTTYRNSINFKRNWISASYAIQFIKESSYINASRSRLKMTSWINGTGFCFTNEVLKLTNDWNFNSLSHDIEFTQFLSLNNIKCDYAHNAIFYDEQPVRFKDSYKQRLRWCKGFLQVFSLYRKAEINSLLTSNKKTKLNSNKKSVYANFAAIFPQISFFLINLTFYILISILLSLLPPSSSIFGIIRIHYYIETPILIFVSFYLMLVFFSITIIFQEHKRIKCSLFKSFLYALLYPFFMFTYVPISLIAIFKKKVSTNPISREKRN